MIIRTTTDPMTLRDVPDPENHPCLYEGDGTNGVEIYFETEENRRMYQELEPGDPKIVQGNDTDDYVAEG